jgi:hypothetical protein
MYYSTIYSCHIAETCCIGNYCGLGWGGCLVWFRQLEGQKQGWLFGTTKSRGDTMDWLHLTVHTAIDWHTKITHTLWGTKLGVKNGNIV